MTPPNEYRLESIEYGSERPCEVARLVLDDGVVMLAYRYTDDGSEWFPTWFGRLGEKSYRLPRGLQFSEEWINKIEALPVVDSIAYVPSAERKKWVAC